MHTPSLDKIDEQSKAVQKTPNRVSLVHIKSLVKSVEYLYPKEMAEMTIAVLILKNGYCVIGKSSPADPKNFNFELGKQYAYEDALRQVWPLEAYLLREQLSND